MSETLQQGDNEISQETMQQPQQWIEQVQQAWDNVASVVEATIKWEEPEVIFTDWASI